jgi:hypothetical protein
MRRLPELVYKAELVRPKVLKGILAREVGPLVRVKPRITEILGVKMKDVAKIYAHEIGKTQAMLRGYARLQERLILGGRGIPLAREVLEETIKRIGRIEVFFPIKPIYDPMLWIFGIPAIAVKPRPLIEPVVKPLIEIKPIAIPKPVEIEDIIGKEAVEIGERIAEFQKHQLKYRQKVAQITQQMMIIPRPKPPMRLVPPPIPPEVPKPKPLPERIRKMYEEWYREIEHFLRPLVLVAPPRKPRKRRKRRRK